jgi:hypothetical protein
MGLARDDLRACPIITTTGYSTNGKIGHQVGISTTGLAGWESQTATLSGTMEEPGMGIKGGGPRGEGGKLRNYFVKAWG